MKRIVKGDKVVIISGKDRGKIGDILDILPKKGKIKVQDVAIAIKHCKARKQSEVSSIKKEESFIDSSNVMFFDTNENKAYRISKIKRSA